jgi:hypothetical protein
MALWPNGGQKWSRNVADFGDPHIAPVIGHQDMIYVAADALLAINRDGTWEWVFWGGPGAPPTPVASAAVDSNGLIYFPAKDGHIYCAAPGGTLAWRYSAALPETWLSAPVVGSDGLVYATDTNRVRALYTGATGPFNGPWPMWRHDAQCTARLDTPWTMRDALIDLIGFVFDADLDGRLKRQLVLRLKSAMRSLDAGLLLPAVHKLGAFVNHVEAQQGKKIPEELADVLIRDALHILSLADGYDGDHGPCRCRAGYGRKPGRLPPGCRRATGQVAAPRSRTSKRARRR